ncbi:MAG: hypothetical protein TU35_007985 [Thermoproteus sp. AZ2]|uniref:Uncharacterized protein n=1 Tax=Thermoproteus sp. AZ2 TaxID=1609232 RepID=A0ACC6V2U3_9CREN
MVVWVCAADVVVVAIDVVAAAVCAVLVAVDVVEGAALGWAELEVEPLGALDAEGGLCGAFKNRGIEKNNITKIIAAAINTTGLI